MFNIFHLAESPPQTGRAGVKFCNRKRLLGTFCLLTTTCNHLHKSPIHLHVCR